MPNRLTQFILMALVLGGAVGWVVHTQYPQGATVFAADAALLPFIFLRLIKMVIAPLVFSTLCVGIGKMGDVATVGRVGSKALAWFFLASWISLTLGLGLVNTLQPGRVLHLSLPAVGTSAGVPTAGLSLVGFIEHTVPSSVVDAMARNEILQIVVFTLFFGTAMAALADRSRPVTESLEVLAELMLKVTTYVMRFAPLAVFGALASTVAERGLGVLAVYGLFVGEFYLGLLVLWVVLLGGVSLVIRLRVVTLLRRIREPLLLAFSTASSEAAYPKTLEELEHFGCSKRVASFVLPMGYSFNLDGSMMYCTFAVMFIAQAYGIELTLAEQFLMLATLMLTSKGIAGVPRASLVVIAATLAQFKIPEAGLLLLLGIDHFLDMGRSATNVIGNSVATVLVSHWEGDLK